MSDMTLVWNIGRFTWLACWWMHMVDMLIEAYG
jgi:hypothetical protein